MDFPEMTTIRQALTSSPLPDPARALDEAFEGASVESVFNGSRVAVAVGSRKIDRLPELVHRIVELLRGSGCEPFIVQAMGSHGGASVAGQLTIMGRLGVTEQSAGAPIDPSLETVSLGTTAGWAEAFMARAALEADGIFLLNRVAPHTGFSGPLQSGVAKMLAVGLGKADGARALHHHGFEAGHLIGELAGLVLEKAPPVLALALVEDARKELSHLEVLRGEEILAREPELLNKAIAMWPRLPVPEADVLVVEEMGKDISGIGMDPLVTGRGKDLPGGQRQSFHARRLVVLRLSQGSGGNATGVGHADITTRAVVEATDVGVTYRNVLTSGALHRARVPLVAGSDREALEMALSSLGHTPPDQARIVWIRNTARLGELKVSSPLVPGVEALEGISVESDAQAIQFDADGNII